MACIADKTLELALMILLIPVVGFAAVSPPAMRLQDKPLVASRHYWHGYQGVITTSFAASAQQAGLDRKLAAAFANIFATRLDFSRELRRGDRWRFIVRQRQDGGRHLGWEDIRAAEYIRHNRSWRAIHYPIAGRQVRYYSPDDGRSLRRTFLRSPVKFARITSGFSYRRLHPLLKVVRPHFGVDYSARAGTEVMSVADGIVVKAGYNNINGWYVKLWHYPFYHTAYCHLQKIAAGLTKGDQVKQGEVIGYVGASGRATGPHLHFSFYERGRYADPLRKQFPAKTSVPHNQRDSFQARARTWLAQLPPYISG